MNDNYPDIIILTGVPENEVLHGLTPTPLPKVQLAAKDKLNENSNKSFFKIGIFLSLLFLIGKYFK